MRRAVLFEGVHLPGQFAGACHGGLRAVGAQGVGACNHHGEVGKGQAGHILPPTCTCSFLAGAVSPSLGRPDTKNPARAECHLISSYLTYDLL